MMAPLCATEENVDFLERAVKEKSLFKKTLNDETLKVLLEIIWNVKKGNGKCDECFSKKTLKGFKTHKKLVGELLKTKKKLRKKKKILLQSKRPFRHWLKKLAKEFVSNCLE